MPDPAPKLARRSANRHSSIRSGRTIGERREKLETASERAAVHKKIKKKQNFRIFATILSFILVAAGLFYFGSLFFGGSEEEVAQVSTTITVPYAPTIEVVDEDASSTGVTGRMKEYIGQAEADLRELGYIPTKAVIPAGAIREVDFYLDGYTGFIKFTIDRGSGVSAEDTDRMLRYLAGQGITDFQYIDVRIDGKAYWK